MSGYEGASFRVAELERKLQNLIQPGRVVGLDAAGARAMVALGELVTAPLPWLTGRAGADREWWAPEPGEQVVVLCPSGDPALGWILPGAYCDDAPANGDRSDVHRTTYKDGAVVEYDRQAHRLRAVLPSGGSADITADGGVTVTGPVHVVGDVQVDGEIRATKDVTADSISLQKHVHGGVQAGGAKTGVPE